ncbi:MULTISPECIES: hypothetical protein [Streptomyces]|uniref:Secreted protein n=1 Tax=Streptomyces solicathayae TaxID=3081768 RepID=A0ABZ0M0I1_9ACTN|nr:hypothetical protein [Streptomyces sp. HUAS YS2]WOX25173.1 hypothetical protein R2D22_28835 [Streptomyces sp. HUAS YS2]
MRAKHRRAVGVSSAAVLLAGTATVLAEVRAAPAVPAERPPAYEASCSTTVEGSRVTAYCHNPYPRTDRVRLHVECEKWWDVDTDSAPVDVGPTAYAELTGRCWKDVRTAWLTHQPERDSAGT